tara:strand:- start:52 stop:471 length:420 start_codon:yes stop_codon:yes gene_type:complete
VNKKDNISKNDKKEWEEYLKNPRDVFDKDNNSENVSIKNLRFKFDLHGYSLSDANEKVRDIITSCYEKKYREIILITGKGIHSNTEKDVYASKDLSKLRHSIPDYINSNEELSKKINKISIANKKDGGDGAIIIKLKNL